MADNMSLYTAPDVFLESTSPMTLSDLSEDIGLRKAFCLKQTAADKLLSDVADVAQKAAAGDLVRKGAKKEVRYVVDIGEELKNAIDSGAVKLDCNKAGEVFAQIYYAHNEIPAMLSVLDEYGRFLEREIAPNAQRLAEFDRSDTLLQNGKWEQRGQLLQSIGNAKRQLTEATVYLLGTEGVNDDQGQAGQSLPQR